MIVAKRSIFFLVLFCFQWNLAFVVNMVSDKSETNTTVDKQTTADYKIVLYFGCLLITLVAFHPLSRKVLSHEYSSLMLCQVMLCCCI